MDKIKYVVTSGCSFSRGQCMSLDPSDEPKYRFSKILADGLEAQDINLSQGGGSNDRAFRKIYEWIQENSDKVKYSLFIIGFTDLSRKELHIDKSALDLNSTNNPLVGRTQRIRWNAHMVESPLITKVFKDVDGDAKDISSKFAKWHLVEYGYLYNDKAERERLFRNADLLQSYIKDKGSNIFYFYALPKLDELDPRLNWYKPGGHNYWWKYINEYRGAAGGHPNKEDHIKLGKDLIKWIK